MSNCEASIESVYSLNGLLGCRPQGEFLRIFMEQIADQHARRITALTGKAFCHRLC